MLHFDDVPGYTIISYINSLNQVFKEATSAWQHCETKESKQAKAEHDIPGRPNNAGPFPALVKWRPPTPWLSSSPLLSAITEELHSQGTTR